MKRRLSVPNAMGRHSIFVASTAGRSFWLRPNRRAMSTLRTPNNIRTTPKNIPVVAASRRTSHILTHITTIPTVTNVQR